MRMFLTTGQSTPGVRSLRLSIPGYAVTAGLCALAGCTPTLDWRDVVIGDSGLQSLFPCKPDVVTRRVRIGGAPVEMTLHACVAGGATFGIGHAVLADAGQASAALDELAATAAANLGAAPGPRLPSRVSGLSTGAPVFRMQVAAPASTASSLQEQAIWFAEGATVFQASVVARRIDIEAVGTFFDGLQIAR